MAATAVLQRRLDEKRAWLRKRSKELVEARGVGADRVEIEWEQGLPSHPIVNRTLPPSPLPKGQIVPPSPTQYSCLFLGVHICAYLLKRGTHSVLAQTASWQGVTLVYLSYPWWL